MEPPDFIRFGRATCCDVEQANRREWWLADGDGRALERGGIAQSRHCRSPGIRPWHSGGAASFACVLEAWVKLERVRRTAKQKEEA